MKFKRPIYIVALLISIAVVVFFTEKVVPKVRAPEMVCVKIVKEVTDIGVCDSQAICSVRYDDDTTGKEKYPIIGIATYKRCQPKDRP